MPSLLIAAPVDRATASQIAANWLSSRTGVTHVARPAPARDALPHGAARTMPTYHIIDLEPRGWVIVSADDVAYPIIGYSLVGASGGDSLPPAFDGWMRGIDASIGEAIRSNALVRGAASESEERTAAMIANAWRALREPRASSDGLTPQTRIDAIEQVGPLIRTTWSQGLYYNASCPLDSRGPDGRALVGCCATAMGQILRYHGQPAVGNGTYTYQHPLYGTLSADFGATRYDWTSMPSSGVLSSPNGAVATLLSHLGISVDMDYGPGWSACFPSRVPGALRDHFRYLADDIAYRYNHTDDAWMTRIRADLDAGRPIFYVGYGTEGHAFVLDGHTSDDYFHFNWGWNGAYDGYFLISNLNPGGSIFTHSQAAVFGIRPMSTPPAAATLLRPSGRSDTATPTFAWNPVPEATHYQLWVDDATSGGEGKIKTWHSAEEAGCAQGGPCAVTPDLALADGSAIWWIQTRNDAGDGPWSAAMRFTVKTGKPPGSASLITPEGISPVSTPTYRWAAVGNASWYWLWVDDITSGGNGKIATWYPAEEVGCAGGGGICSITPDTALVNGPATWWIQTWNDNGDGPWSEGKSFVVDARSPEAATLRRPRDLITNPRPSYEWNAVKDATWYYLWVDDRSSAGEGKIKIWYPADEAGCGSGRGVCRIRPTTSLVNGSATWWIQTWNDNGEGPWSEPLDFKVDARSAAD
jgi:hypothetical protein